MKQNLSTAIRLWREVQEADGTVTDKRLWTQLYKCSSYEAALKAAEVRVIFHRNRFHDAIRKARKMIDKKKGTP